MISIALRRRFTISSSLALVVLCGIASLRCRETIVNPVATPPNDWKLLSGTIATNAVAVGITDIVVDREGVAFATSYGTGVLKSSDGGRSWLQSSSGLSQIYLDKIAIDGSGTLYAVQYGGGSVCRSSDFGNTWKTLTLPTDRVYPTTVHSIAFDDQNVLYAGTPRGLWRSFDQGDHWIRVDVDLPDTNVLAVTALSPGVVIALGDWCRNCGGNAYLSHNGGANWAKVTEMDGGSIRFIRASQHRVYATQQNALQRSDNEGKTWVRFGIDASNVMDVVEPSPGHILAATDKGLFLSSNDGASWAVLHNELYYRNARALARLSNGDLLAALDTGTARSTDGGVSWSTHDADMILQSVLAVSEIGGDMIACGSKGDLFQSHDTGASWSMIASNGARPFSKIIGIAGKGVIAGDNYEAYLSTDSMHSWSRIMSSVYNATTMFGTSWGEVFVGNSGRTPVWHSDLLSTWTSCDSMAKNEVVVAFCEGATEILYAATRSDSMMRSTNRGQTWVFCGPHTRFLTSSLDGTTYACDTDHCWRSDDGVAWTSIGDPFQSMELQSMVCDSRGRIYVGTAGGIYRSTDRGVSWSTFDNGLPSALIRSLLINSGGYLFAATEGGVYRSAEPVSP